MLVCYIISDINKALAFEWIAVALQKNHDIRFILLNGGESALESFLKQSGIPVVRITCRGKRDWPRAWYQLLVRLREWKPQAVHCHLLQASILGLSAAWWAGIDKRIITRHHANLHHRHHKKGVLWDKLCNALATDIVAITENVKNILLNMDHAPTQKITVIPHGFDWQIFRGANSVQVQKLRDKYVLNGRSPVIGCIARFIELKGIQYIIPAFRQFLQSYPEAVLVLANAQGDYARHLHQLLATLPSENYRLITFEPALGELYQCFDLFVHVPVDSEVEAFGQTYVEALAAEVPSIFTLSGIAPEFIEHGQNAWVVPFRDSTAILTALLTLWEDPMMRTQLKKNGWSSVQEKFALSQMISRLEALYAK
ncbi:MAG: glycosyltransferase family 4 protein [Methylobacter sp.]